MSDVDVTLRYQSKVAGRLLAEEDSDQVGPALIHGFSVEDYSPQQSSSEGCEQDRESNAKPQCYFSPNRWETLLTDVALYGSLLLPADEAARLASRAGRILKEHKKSSPESKCECVVWLCVCVCVCVKFVCSCARVCMWNQI